MAHLEELDKTQSQASFYYLSPRTVILASVGKGEDCL